MTSPDSIDVRENISLAALTTLQVGGPARFFVRAGSESQVVDAFGYAERNGLKVFVLGGGSNVLVSDRGFDGLVIQPALRGIKVSEASSASGDGAVVQVTAGAGEDWDTFVDFCIARNLAGIECLSGIPGFVGGTPVQNVGAYGQEVSESITSVRCFDRAGNSFVDLDNADCGFTYRTSIFNSTDRERYVVLAVTYDLIQNGEPKIAYKDLKEYFVGGRPTLQETREAVLAIRGAKSMVIDPDDPNSRSAGSFFKNPILTTGQFEKLVSNFDGIGNVPHFPSGGNDVKVPAAWLIEQSGFQKGYTLGNAGMSTKHSLALVNLGGASAAEIVALKEKIQEGVQLKFDILLQPEPVFVGFD